MRSQYSNTRIPSYFHPHPPDIIGLALLGMLAVGTVILAPQLPVHEPGLCGQVEERSTREELIKSPAGRCLTILYMIQCLYRAHIRGADSL